MKICSAQNAELEETTEELRSQQEELRASAERLEAQAQTLETKNTELERLSGSLEAKAEELAVSSRYKSEFLANMSHELRTPLNSILILAGLLTDSDEPLSDKQHEFADTIQQSGKDLLNLIDEVLDLAKVESGSMYLEEELIEVSELVSFLERTFGPIAADKGIGFRVSVDETAPRQITSDYTRVKQIAKNLVANAVKFTDQGAVTVRFLRKRRRAGESGYRVPLDGRRRHRHRDRREGSQSHLRVVPAGRARDGAAIRRHRPRTGHQPRTGPPPRR